MSFYTSTYQTTEYVTRFYAYLLILNIIERFSLIYLSVDTYKFLYVPTFYN